MSKIANAVIWGTIGQFLRIGLKFSVTVYLAKLLSPNEFGLIGKVSIILAVLNTLGTFGLSSSLIQKKNVSAVDYSTVFWANISFGLIFSTLLLLCSSLLADFYNTPQLTSITQILSLSIIINSFTIVPQTILIKNLQFKQLETYTFFANLLSSLLGLYLAYTGNGVWSLVFQNISSVFFLAGSFWLFEPWKPSFEFDRSSFKRLSGFGSNMAASGLLDMIFSNLDSILIGKYFSTSIMGFYTYSQSLTKTILNVLVGPIFKALFPALSQVQDDNVKLKEAYKKFVGIVNFMVLPAMCFIIVMSEEIITVLLDKKWEGLAQYLRFFAIISIIYNHCAININIISAKGKGRLFFRLEVVKKMILCGSLLVGFQFGIFGILISLLIYWLITLGIDVYFSGKVSEYSWLQQIIDLIPNYLIVIFNSMILFTFKYYLFKIEYTIGILILLTTVNTLIYLMISYILRLEALFNVIALFNKLRKSL